MPLLDETHGLRAVGPLGDHLDVVDRAEQRAQPVPEHRVVVDQHHADHGPPTGSRAVTRVPPCSRPPRGRLPPSSVARSRIAVRPTPPGRPHRGPRRRPRSRRSSSVRRRPWPARSGRSGGGVPPDVGERLGGDPVGRHLDGRRELRQCRPRPTSTSRPGSRSVTLRAWWRSAPTRPSWSRSGGRRSSTSRRTSASDCCTSTLSWSASSAASSACRRRHPLHGVEAQRDPGQGGTEAVVQVAPDPPPLLLAHGDETLAGALQVVRQAGGVHRDPDLPAEVVEQPQVGRRGTGRAATAAPPAGDRPTRPGRSAAPRCRSGARPCRPPRPDDRSVRRPRSRT